MFETQKSSFDTTATSNMQGEMYVNVRTKYLTIL